MFASPVPPHAPFEGIGAFYNGFLHPFVDPAQAVLLVTTGALLGQHGLAAMRRSAPGLLGSLAVGMLAHRLTGWTPEDIAPALVLALLAGIAAAAGLAAPARALPLLVALAGLWIGLATDTREVVWGRETRFQAGAALGSAWGLLCLAGTAELARAGWQRIGVRVVASWGAAAALIVLAFESTNAGPA